MKAIRASGRTQATIAACCLLGLLLWRIPSVLGADTPSTQPLEWLGTFIRERGLFLGMLLVFVVGLGLNLTPCVYPIIPVTVAFFSGQSSGSTWRTLQLAILYVLGISLSYAALGAVTASAGVLLGAWLQQPVVLIVIAGTIVALALSMFGLYDLRLPSVVTQRLGRSSSGMLGAFSMGLVFGLIAAPCVGPFVGGLILFVTQQGDPRLGFLLFFILGLGMGLPYVVLGMAAQRVTQLPKAGPWLIWSKNVLGVILLGLALYFLRPLLPSRVLWLAVVTLLAGAGLYLGWLERSPARGLRFLWVRRVVGSLCDVSALVMAWPRPQAAVTLVNWESYTEAAFAQAQRAGRPIIVDVYADWCLPCVEMDHVTFHHPDVVKALGSVETFRLDVTDEVSADGERLITRYGIYGAPTILLFDRSGTERKELRILGFEPPEEFLELLKRIL